MARQNYSAELEAALNEQIHMEQSASQQYRAMWAYFSRDSVALPGMAKFLGKNADEEAGHAKQMMEYQIKRGGVVNLKDISTPQTEFSNSEIGDACFCMEKVLELEKAVNQNLLDLHAKSDAAGDIQMSNFIEDFLDEQVDAIKEISDYVSMLRRVGSSGLAVYTFDRDLAEKC